MIEHKSEQILVQDDLTVTFIPHLSQGVRCSLCGRAFKMEYAGPALEIPATLHRNKFTAHVACIDKLCEVVHKIRYSPSEEEVTSVKIPRTPSNDGEESEDSV